MNIFLQGFGPDPDLTPTRSQPDPDPTVACGGGQRVGEGGERQRATKAAAAACGGRLFSVTSDGT